MTRLGSREGCVYAASLRGGAPHDHVVRRMSALGPHVFRQTWPTWTGGSSGSAGTADAAIETARDCWGTTRWDARATMERSMRASAGAKADAREARANNSSRRDMAISPGSAEDGSADRGRRIRRPREKEPAHAQPKILPRLLVTRSK